MKTLKIKQTVLNYTSNQTVLNYTHKYNALESVYIAWGNTEPTPLALNEKIIASKLGELLSEKLNLKVIREYRIGDSQTSHTVLDLFIPELKLFVEFKINDSVTSSVRNLKEYATQINFLKKSYFKDYKYLVVSPLGSCKGSFNLVEFFEVLKSQLNNKESIENVDSFISNLNKNEIMNKMKSQLDKVSYNL